MDAAEPCGPSSKKAKSESRDEAVTGAPVPDRTATELSAEPPPPGVDRISDLPDGVLGEIITLLPTNIGASTQILASRWRHLWRSAALNIDFRFRRFRRNGSDLSGAVSCAISTHPGPCRRFCVPAYYLVDRPDTVDAWLRYPSLDGLQELEFCYLSRSKNLWQPQQLAPPPASAFRFSPTLRVLTLGMCLLPDATTQALHLPQLTHLALERVRISECSLRSLIARCPALKCLLLYYSFGFRCARINSASLISLGVRLRRGSHNVAEEPQFRELIIENAPCLERLLRLDLLDGLNVSVISAPKLETLCSLNDELYLHSTIIQGLPHDTLTTAVGAVKVLCVNLFIFNLDMTIELMKCFPQLEKLYIHQDIAGEKYIWRRKHRVVIKSLDIRLKKVVMDSYRGIRAQVSFATFFILNAKMLELMQFRVDHKHYTRRFLAEQRKELELEKRASRGARFEFKTDRMLQCHSVINNVRDLDLSDPFVCMR